MEFKSYMRDYHGTHVSDKDRARTIGKGMLTVAGLITMLIGFVVAYNAPKPLYIFLGVVVIICGLCVILYGFIYFRKIRRVKH